MKGHVWAVWAVSALRMKAKREHWVRPCRRRGGGRSGTGRRRKTDHPWEVLEAALAHVLQNEVEAAYARSDLFERRRRLIDDWAAYLAATSVDQPLHRPDSSWSGSVPSTPCGLEVDPQISLVARRYLFGTCIALVVLCSSSFVVWPVVRFIVIRMFVTLSSVLSSIQTETKA